MKNLLSLWQSRLSVEAIQETGITELRTMLPTFPEGLIRSIKAFARNLERSPPQSTLKPVTSTSLPAPGLTIFKHKYGAMEAALRALLHTSEYDDTYAIRGDLLLCVTDSGIIEDNTYRKRFGDTMAELKEEYGALFSQWKENQYKHPPQCQYSIQQQQQHDGWIREVYTGALNYVHKKLFVTMCLYVLTRMDLRPDGNLESSLRRLGYKAMQSVREHREEKRQRTESGKKGGHERM